jgi:hypothetical protein
VIDIDGTEKVTPIVIDECAKAPQASFCAYYNVVHPDDGANWQIRAQVQFMFPK